MAATARNGDICHIQDEDTLRQMWQETEDFTRKKDIRSQMYKMREARLRDFYTSGEVGKDIQRTNSSPGLRTVHSKGPAATHHADSLMDNSFLSLKSKEIRDSESPTRDLSYKINEKLNDDREWSVKHSNERSQDGKTHTTSRLATTSGTEKIDGGQANYAAKNEQMASVFQDGDDKNFTKSVGASSKNVVKQEARGGDENSQFYSAATSSKSSSKFVTESKSSEPTQITYTNTSRIPDELKCHPNYVEGKTKVFTETKTLPDGSRVTTTRYETVGGESKQVSSSSSKSEKKHYSTSSDQKHSSSRSEQKHLSSDVARGVDEVDKAGMIVYTEPKQVTNYKTESTKFIDNVAEKHHASTNVEHKKLVDSRHVSSNVDQRKFVDQHHTNTNFVVDQQHASKLNQIDQHQATVNVDLRKSIDQRQSNVDQYHTSTNVENKKSVEHHTSSNVTDQTHKVTDQKHHISVDQKVDTNKSVHEKVADKIVREVVPIKSQPATKPTDDFIRVEKQHFVDTAPKPYDQPERRQPIKPAKSEMETKREPTDGQYDTTYRADYTSKKISVEVSATHDAFARSLRSVTPERDRPGSARSMRTSNTSLRSSTSPEKFRHSSRVSPDKNGRTPDYDSSTLTRRPKKKDTVSPGRTTTYDSSTLTRRPKKKQPRSPSPTATVSDFEFHQVTDLDQIQRHKSLDLKTTRKVTERSPTTPLSDTRHRSPTSPRRHSDFKPFKAQTTRADKVLRRTDTYEERCRQILGIEDKRKTETRKPSLPDVTRRTSPVKSARSPTKSPERTPAKSTRSPPKSPEKSARSPTKSPERSPAKSTRSPTKSPERRIQEFPAQIRRSPERKPSADYRTKSKPTKSGPQLSEFPAQKRKSLGRPTNNTCPVRYTPKNTEKPKVQEFPAQIRRSPEKKLHEIPAQIRKVPSDKPSNITGVITSQMKRDKNRTEETQLISSESEEETIETTSQEIYEDIMKRSEEERRRSYQEVSNLEEAELEISRSTKEVTATEDFMSKVRDSREIEERQTTEHIEIDVQKKREFEDEAFTKKDISGVRTDSQILRETEKSDTEDLTSKQYAAEHIEDVTISTQARKQPVVIQICPSKPRKSPNREVSSTQEFITQAIRKTSEDEEIERKNSLHLRDSSERQQHKESKSSRTTEISQDLPKNASDEFPAQIRKSPPKDSPTIQEFPSQIMKSPEKDGFIPHPSKTPKKTEAPSIQEFPSQIRKSPERQVPEPYPERKVPKQKAPTVQEFPSQIRKSPEKDDLKPYPTKNSFDGEAPSVPAQIRKSPERLNLEPYPERKSSKKETSTVQEFPSQIRRSPEKDGLEPYPTKKTQQKEAPSVQEFPPQIRKSTKRQEIETYPERKSPKKETPTIEEFPAQIRKSPERPKQEAPLERRATKKIAPTVQEFPAQIRKSPKKQESQPYPDRKTIKSEAPTISEFPAQAKKQPEKPKSRPCSERVAPKKESVTVKEFPAQIKKQPVNRDLRPEFIAKKTKSPQVQSAEDELIAKTVKYLDGKRVPVDEPLFVKKFMTQLGSDEEEEVEVTKKTVKKDLSSTVKKDLSRTTKLVQVKGIPSVEKPKHLNVVKKISTAEIKIRPILNGDISPNKQNGDIKLKQKKPVGGKQEAPKKKVVTVINLQHHDQPKITKKQAKCVTTKSIIINEAVADQREIIVDLRRSQSSREETPDQIWPISATEEDSGIPRYPDQILEPEEHRHASYRPRTIDVPLTEDEDVNHFTRCVEIVDEQAQQSVNEKVNKFNNQQPETVKQGPPPKVERPEFTDVDETLRRDECLLSVTDKVNKFISTAEKLTVVPDALRPKSPRCQNFTHLKKKVSLEDLVDLEKRVSTEYLNKRTSSESLHRDTKRVSLEDITEMSRTSRRRSSQEEKVILSDVGRLRSTESIKKAKALFEKDVLSRPSVFDGPDGDRPGYMRDLDRSQKDRSPSPRKRSPSPEIVPHRASSPVDESTIPRYMRQLDRSLREKSPHKQSVLELEEIAKGHVSSIHTSHEDIKATTKFGVVLKKTESEHKIERRRSSTTVVIDGVTKELEIEEIFDLELLESMLEKVIGYELRRRIRSQIRIVKNLIAENKVTTKTEYLSKFTRKSSLENKSVENRLHKHSDLIVHKDTAQRTTEYQSKYTPTKTTKSTSPIRTKEEIVVRTTIRTKPEEKVFIPAKTKSPTRVTAETKPKSPTRSTAESKPRSPTRTTVPEFKPFRRSPERKFTTDLKRTAPPSKAVRDDKPEWVTQRRLKKVEERTVTPTSTRKVYSSSTVSTSSSKKEVRGSSPGKATDVITSGYGVGPTDENGTPLFGLKALRAQQRKNEKSRVQGTVTHSTYYSENGGDPVGEISVTKYSTDPTDLGIAKHDLKYTNGIVSKTTTQKFGYKDTPTFKSITDKKRLTEKKSDETRTTTSSTSSKVTRRGSVKEMSQKFLDNAVESIKSERQTTYPKAGLILRTSSFKDSRGSSREGSPQSGEEMHKTVTVRTSTTRSGGEDSFLTNTSKVTNVQDVISRMKCEEYREGDSVEDAEARNLLNKFLGSQVILAGMEGRTSASSSTAATSSSASKRITKVTTTVTENGIPKTTTRTFTHPVTLEILETVWDEQTLQLLLEQSTEYEERRIIRARLKQVMAEKEACAQLVEKTIEETNTGNIQGESLLLPLLQGVLDAPEFEQTADSGTESGEDLRSGLIVEVQNALDKLTACLSSSTTEISPERRDSLLQLVTKLQANLVSTKANAPPNPPERRSSVVTGGRYAARRRNRQNRHTVGVTSEELEDARRLMAEFALTASTNFGLRKQNSESAVQKSEQPPVFKPVKFQPKQSAIKNSTAKPFMTSSNTSGTSSTVGTPSTEGLELLFTEKPDDSEYFQNATKLRQSISLDNNEISHVQKRPLSQSISLDYTIEIDLLSAVQQAAALKKAEIASESDNEDANTVKHDESVTPNQLIEGESVVLYDQSVYPTHSPIIEAKPDLILQSNPIYNDNNRFSTKKLKMKRANTIDIPKPLNFYEYDDESDGDELNQRRSNYLALRGPIRVGKLNSETKVPTFEPKTESDKKFVAFINKNSGGSVVSKVNLWDKNVSSQNNANWQNKFGSIKVNFESGEANKPAPKTSGATSTARNFWKSADDSVSAGTISYNGPKISRQNARNLQEMFEQKRNERNNVVTGQLKFEPHKFAPVNKFSHNPQSAFQPIQRRPENLKKLSENSSDSSAPDTPLYLYSPKSFEVMSPPASNVAPWANNKGERRVLGLAASKFEPLAEEMKVEQPRRLSKDKVSFPKVDSKEKLPAYTAYPGRNTSSVAVNSSSSVRKLSGQYEAPKHQSAFAPVVPQKSANVYKHKPSTPIYEACESPDNTYQSFVVQYAPKSNKPATYKSSKSTVHIEMPSSYNSDSRSRQYHKGQTSPSYQTNPLYDYKSEVTVETRNKVNSVPHNVKVEDYNARNSSGKRDSRIYQPDIPEVVPPSFHTTSPQVQHLQQQYQKKEVSNANSSSKRDSRIYQPDIPEVIPHSFHTASPQVQHVQQYHKDAPVVNSSSKRDSRIYQPDISEEPPHSFNTPVQHSQQQYHNKESPAGVPNIYYNNVSPQVAQQSSVQETNVYYNNVNTNYRPTYETQSSQESVHEYNAVSVRVMKSPLSQQAVTVAQNAPKSRNEHDMDMALMSSLQKVDRRSPLKPKSPSFTAPSTRTKSSPRKLSPLPNFLVNDKPLNMQSLEVNDEGETIITSKIKINVSNDQAASKLNKADSWHQICDASKRPSSRASPKSSVLKSKSSHTLALPKQFEAGLNRDEIATKKRTVEAYFCGGKTTSSTKKSLISRTKTSDKGLLCRSRTLPDIVCPDMLDESNVDEAFEDLFKACT